MRDGTHDAIVVGGGVAGLVAASVLASGGRRVLLLEARGRLGGRASSFPERVTGDVIDNGQHILMGCYRETLRWLDRVGSLGGLRGEPSLRVPMIDERGERVVLTCPRLPAPWHLVAGVLGWPALPWRDRLSVLRLAPVVAALRRATSFADAWALAPREETVAGWLARHGQSGALQRLLWEPLTVAALNQSITRASAGAFLSVLKGVAAGTAADARILLPAQPLVELFGASTARYLEAHGSSVRLHSPARITCDDSSPAVVRVRGEVLHARSVIVAVPWFHLGTVLSGSAKSLAALQRQVGAMGWSPIVSTNLWYDRTVLSDAFVGLPGRTMQWAFSHVAREGGQRVSLVVSDAAAAMGESDASLIARAAGEMREAVASAAGAAVRHAIVVREPRATFDVGPRAAARPPTLALAPHVFLAGDWVDTGLPSTIESAALSGRMAAEAALGF